MNGNYEITKDEIKNILDENNVHYSDSGDCLDLTEKEIYINIENSVFKNFTHYGNNGVISFPGHYSGIIEFLKKL